MINDSYQSAGFRVSALFAKRRLFADSAGEVASSARHLVHPLAPSLNLSCANEFADVDALGDAHANKYSSVRYSRDSSDLVLHAERCVSALHGSSLACLFQSGMAAVDAALTVALNHVKAVAIIGSIYRKSMSLVELKAGERDIRCIRLNSVDDFLAISNDLPLEILVFAETPCNPFLELQDVVKLRAGAPNSLIILDVTLQGLANDRLGLHFYADILISSCTKYIGGHNDLLAGYAVTRRQDLYQKLWELRSMRGSILDSLSAFLLLRSLRTYDARIERQVSSVGAVLSFLDQSEKVDRIYYPGAWANNVQDELFRSSHYHGGSVVSFELDSSVNIKRNIGSLMVVKMAPSFGSVDSLIEIPALMSYWGKASSELMKIGISESLVRLSVGLEPPDLIISDLTRLVGID